MGLTAVIGSQWGDEGKGRVVDLLARDSEFVARFSGGDNAGHTVKVQDRRFALHLIPSGIVHEHTTGLLGNGMVINPVVLWEEMNRLRDAGIDVSPDRIRIAFNAHLITPGHLALDQAREDYRGENKIGTTQRGIGPAYTSKVNRSGLRMVDILDKARFEGKLASHLQDVNQQLEKLFEVEPLDAAPIMREYLEYALKYRAYLDDVGLILQRALDQGRSVLAEGAQGTLLDLDHGTYPFVTSSTPSAPGMLVGLGLGVGYSPRVIGVTKAFQTRVGEGPFPTELQGETARELRGTGENFWDEFGTTTGRPRRVGWLDGVLLRYAARINGLTELVVTKLDILTGLNSLKICTGYQVDEEIIGQLPLGPDSLAEYEPAYEELAGWNEDVTAIRSWKKLPQAAQEYIRLIEETAGLPVKMISVGPERDQIIRR